MANSKLTRLLFFRKGILENISKRIVLVDREVQSRNLHGSNWRASLKEKLKTNLPTQSGSVSIYKVPTDLHQVEPKAYEPNIVSIGPYHHGLARLKAMEDLKWSYFHRLFHQNQNRDAKLDNLIDELKKLEQEARECYEEDLKLTKDEFTKIMLLDGCFVVELFRELTKNNDSVFIKRWMLPILRRDLIMLENQLPLFVLCKVFELTSIGSKTQNPSLLKELALQFFDPLLARDPNTIKQSSSTGPGDNKAHFLDLFRSSILPRIASRGKEPHMFRSIAELKESGIKIKKAEEICRPLKLSFNKGVLKIPPLYFDDYKFTLFRNMVAFEQCHSVCKADVTMYLFFLDGLINSAKDIELLHYAGVIQHSLGGNKQVARLVNKLCREVASDVDESYLHNMVWRINCYCNDGLTTKIAKLKHDYFYNPWASISTLAAILLLYLSLLQTTFALAEAEAEAEAESYLAKTGFWVLLKDLFLIACPRLFWSTKSTTMIPIIPEAGFKDYEYILGIQSSYYELFRYSVYCIL